MSTLSRGQRRVLVALAESLLPEGGAIEPGARSTDLAAQFEAYVGAMPARARRTVRLLLSAFAVSSVASRHGRPFHRLSPAARESYLHSCEVSRLRQRREALVGLKALLLMLYCADERIRPLIGYTGTPRKAVERDPGVVELAVSHPAVPVSERVDVVVVGSGAGGSVAALELARAGRQVVVLEEGGYFNRRDFAGPLPERLRRLYRDAGLTFTIGSPVISLPMGKGVGGSTLINSGTCLRPPANVLEGWRRVAGLELPEEELGDVFEEVERNLHVTPVGAGVMGANGEVMALGASRLGLSAGPIPRNERGCHGSGVCAFGCPLDAKLGMHVSYLPAAVAAGARVFSGVRVERVVVEGGRAVGVRGWAVDAETGARRHPVEIRADAVVLAAGAVHSADLLLRNRLAGSSGQLGRNFRIHPGLGVLAFFDRDLDAWQGVMQSYHVDERVGDGILLEATYPPPGAGYSAGGLGAIGLELKDALSRYRRSAAGGLIVSDTSAGRVRAAPGGPLMFYSVGQADASRLLEGLALACETYLAAAATEVHTLLPGLPPIRRREELGWITEGRWKASHLKLSAYHPMGTCRMGADPRSSVVDEFGRAHDLPGLVICDASVLPGSTHVNPQITIMALATRIARRLAGSL
ncbi:MAG TPA: GMC family oxidoreductase N-terminal domain-containing protein [Candidatus Dormibacteraeota bacterium]